MELTSNEAVKQAILAGLGYSIKPLIGIRNVSQNGDLQIIPVKRLPVNITWSLVWLKGKQHAPVAAAFLHDIKKEKVNIAATKFHWYEQY